MPEPGSDVVEMFERPELWPQARSKMTTMGLPSQYLYPTCGAVCKNNSWQRLVAARAFSKLASWNIPLNIAVGSVKPDIHCDARQYAREAVDIYFRNIRDQGGRVDSVTMDWPLASGRQNCGQNMTTTASHVLNYVRTVQSGYSQLHPGRTVKIGLWEGSPTFSPTEIIQWLEMLRSGGYKPHHFIADFDHARFRREGRITEMKNSLRQLMSYCRSRGILFGVAIWGNDLRSPTTYYAQARQYSREVNQAIGAPDFTQIISWEYWVQKQNVGTVFPYNLPEADPFSHLRFFLEMRSFFEGFM